MFIMLITAFLLYHEKLDQEPGVCLMLFGLLEVLVELIFLADLLK